VRRVLANNPLLTELPLPSLRTSLTTLLCMTLCGLHSLPVAAEGDAAAQAAQVAATVQSFYDQTKDLSAHFQQTYFNKIYSRTERSQGQVVFKKPGKMRWDYEKPNGKVIVADGKKLLVYEPGQEGEPNQILEQQMGNAQLSNAMAFLMGTGRLADDFSFRELDPTHKQYPGGAVLELQPRKPTPHYARIVFYVSFDPQTRGLVQRIVIIDHNGNRNRFDFSKLKFNGQVPDSRFQFKPPAGTRRVTL